MSIKLQILLNFREMSPGNHTCWSVRHPGFKPISELFMTNGVITNHARSEFQTTGATTWIFRQSDLSSGPRNQHIVRWQSGDVTDQWCRQPATRPVESRLGSASAIGLTTYCVCLSIFVVSNGFRMFLNYTAWYLAYYLFPVLQIKFSMGECIF